MKNKEDMLEEKTLKLILIQGLCEKHIVRCPASAAQAERRASEAIPDGFRGRRGVK